MSFRARLTAFFALIVIVPMAAVGVLGFRLIDDSSTGKADARAAGAAATATSLYRTSSRAASLDARTVARDLAYVPAAQLPDRARQLRRRSGILRLRVAVGGRTIADVGDRTAVAPGIAVVAPSPAPRRRATPRSTRSVTVSELSAAEYVQQLAGAGTDAVVHDGARVLAASSPAVGRQLARSPGRAGDARRTVAAGGRHYRAVTERLAGFGGSHVSVTVLSDLAATRGAVGAQRALAAAFIIGFLLLAAVFTVLASRGLQRQVSRFLDAARRLAGGDFSSPIETTGHDEFAALGEEFNRMSRELQRRLDELEEERSRVRSAIRRIGDAFASGLDRDALLALALRTAMDATEATRGRLMARDAIGDPLTEARREGALDGLKGAVHETERAALSGGAIAETTRGESHVATVPLGAIVSGGPVHGVITVVRDGRGFTADDLELLRSLASRATLALANVNIHDDVRRQAVTDDLTGLASHGHFQELLAAEMREARRYDYPVALIMIDIDNFKSVNDTYGHPQGDVVLRHVAEVLRDSSREADLAARYGGEEMALVLPHTDLDGAYEIAERVRTAIERLELSRLDGGGRMHVTTSIGAAARQEGDKDALIADADAALYVAKRTGKNRTVRADALAANERADAVAGAAGE